MSIYMPSISRHLCTRALLVVKIHAKDRLRTKGRGRYDEM